MDIEELSYIQHDSVEEVIEAANELIGKHKLQPVGGIIVVPSSHADVENQYLMVLGGKRKSKYTLDNI